MYVLVHEFRFPVLRWVEGKISFKVQQTCQDDDSKLDACLPRFNDLYENIQSIGDKAGMKFHL